MHSETLTAGIVGVSGYTGAELLRLLAGHPRVRVTEAYAARHAGRRVADILPHLGTSYGGLVAAAFSDDVEPRADVYFLCLPHGTSHAIAKRLVGAGKRVIDLSADFRFRDVARYEAVYGVRHEAPELLGEAVYGLVEANRARIAAARLVANPGCLARATLLALLPLQAEGLAREGSVPLVDAKTGVSGAGRTARDDIVFSEVNEDARPYNPLRHRHVAEIEQALSEAGRPVRVSFVPHLVPMDRGILASAYIELSPGVDPGTVRGAFERAYAGSPFMRVLGDDTLPSTKRVRGTNRVEIGFAFGPVDGRVAVFVALDNLVAGASGNAVHCLNLMAGFDEDEGLRGVALWP